MSRALHCSTAFENMRKNCLDMKMPRCCAQHVRPNKKRHFIEKQTILCGCGGPLAFGATRGRTCIRFLLEPLQHLAAHMALSLCRCPSHCRLSRPGSRTTVEIFRPSRYEKSGTRTSENESADARTSCRDSKRFRDDPGGAHRHAS